MLSRARARLAARDSNRRALRRGFRVALVVPVTLAALMNLPWISQGALFGVFSCLSLLVFADFGGDARRRTWSYLATTAAGVPLVAVGAFAGQTMWSSVLMMAVVAMIVGMIGVLRGPVTSAQSVLLLGTVITLTASSPSSALVDVVAWTIGGLTATAAASLLWPVSPTRLTRRHLATTLDAVADAVNARWGAAADPDALQEARRRLNASLEALHESYDGNLARPAGATSTERALAELVDEVSRLRFMQKWEDLSEHKDPRLRASAEELAAVTGEALQSCANRLRGGRGSISTRALLEARQRNLTQVADWLPSDSSPHDPTAKRQQIDDMFPLRITNVLAARISDQTIALGARAGDEPSDPGGPLSPVRTDPPGKRQRLRAHASWDSPWFRNALRSMVALSLSIAVAKSVTLEHPFWIVLGTLSALRFDALGTGRTARQALIGTVAGVVVSAGLIVLLGPDTWAWWFIFPGALFLAAYTPGTFSLAVGQAAFSLVIIVMFSIVTPARLETATTRVVDVALGLAISLIVSLLMWPRGVVQTLNKRFSEAMTAACDLYVAAVDWLAGGAIDDRLLAGFQERSFEALDRATEALDLSIAQRPPQAIELSRWTMFSNTVGHVDFAARLTGPAAAIVRSHGIRKPVPDALVGPLLTGANEVRAHLLSVSEQWYEQQGPGDPESTREAEESQFPLSPTVVTQRQAVDAYLAGPGDWHGSGGDPRPVIVTWLTDWTAMLDRGAQVLARSLD
ncbi:MAG: FUSC family protein [Candidatus Nanopelagicales bacterium]